MAGLLRYLPRHVLQSDVWGLPNCLALWLSYRFLSPYLKPCFSYLSKYVPKITNLVMLIEKE
uniref:Uncharacterized protein n=1 Tax=Cannabis sativa TaxID=3483 RepID=A0A803QTR5_CANSA